MQRFLQCACTHALACLLKRGYAKVPAVCLHTRAGILAEERVCKGSCSVLAYLRLHAREAWPPRAQGQVRQSILKPWPQVRTHPTHPQLLHEFYSQGCGLLPLSIKEAVRMVYKGSSQTPHTCRGAHSRFVWSPTNARVLAHTCKVKLHAQRCSRRACTARLAFVAVGPGQSQGFCLASRYCCSTTTGQSTDILTSMMGIHTS